MRRREGLWRAAGWGAALAVLLTIAALTAVLVIDVPLTGRDSLPAVVVLAVACAGEDGAVGTPVVVTLDTASGELTVFDPLTEVAIPGTTYDRLRDAYAFGGGPAVAAAIARLEGGPTPGYVVLEEDAWIAAVDAAGGLALDSPGSVEVFTGERLFSFPAGRQVLSGVETREYLKGAAYLADTQRVRIAEQFAAALVAAVSVAEPGSAGIVTGLSDEAFIALRGRF